MLADVRETLYLNLDIIVFQSPMQSENIEAALSVLTWRALLDILSVGEKLQKHVA